MGTTQWYLSLYTHKFENTYDINLGSEHLLLDTYPSITKGSYFNHGGQQIKVWSTILWVDECHNKE